MKILYLIDTRSLFSQKWCNTFCNTDNEIYLISFFQPKNINEKVKVISVESNFSGHRIKYLSNYFKIKKIVNEIKPDIIHAIQVTRQGFLATLINYHPFIITAIGSDVFIEPKKSSIEKWIVQHCFDKADLVTSMAEHMTDYIKQNFRINEKKIITFPWGCDTKIFNLENRNVNEDEIIILSTRSMHDKLYNQELILKSALNVLKKYSAAKFVFIGEGCFREKYERLAVEFGIRNNVIFLGWQSPEQIANWLKKSIIFVSVALSDGNNISLNEAMACGCFPICSDIPANRQWYKNGESGFLVNPDDANELSKRIIQAIEDKKFREDSIKINYKTIKECGDWNKQAIKMLEIYNDLK